MSSSTYIPPPPPILHRNFIVTEPSASNMFLDRKRGQTTCTGVQQSSAGRQVLAPNLPTAENLEKDLDKDPDNVALHEENKQDDVGAEPPRSDAPDQLLGAMTLKAEPQPQDHTPSYNESIRLLTLLAMLVAILLRTLALTGRVAIHVLTPSGISSLTITASSTAGRS